MTEEQIIQSLEICAESCDVNKNVIAEAIELIRGLKTENAKLIAENKAFEASNDDLSKSFLELSIKNIEQKRKLDALESRYNLATSEREANVKGFTEENLKQQVELDKLCEENAQLSYDFELLKQEKNYVERTAIEEFGENLKVIISDAISDAVDLWKERKL